MNKIAITLFLLIASLYGNTQQQVFSGYTLSDGLSQSVVNCIFQDSQGFIWLGTQNGLNKFDGYTFEILTYRPDDLTSISNNWIYAIAEDKEANLWIGTKGGLNKYNRREKRFERISYSTPFPNDVTEYVYDVKCAQNGDILINTPPVLTICNPVAMTFTHHVSPLPYDGSVKDYKIPLLEAADGHIWMGSTTGVACFQPETKKFHIYANDPQNETSLSNDNITALNQDGQSQIWIGTQEGLNQFNSESNSFIRFLHDSGNELSLNNNFIRAIEGDVSGSIWIGTEGGGVSRMHSDAEGTGRFEAFTAGNSGLLHNHVFSLAIDRSRNLWIGSLAGLNKTDLKKQKFRLYRNSDSPYSVDLAGNVIASIFKDDNDIIWIGYWGQGLDIFDRKSGKVEHYSSALRDRNFLPNDFVHTIFKDAANTLWIGTRDGLLVYREQSNSFVRPAEFADNQVLPDFTGLRIFMMTQGRTGDYWIATQDGLFRKRADGSPIERFHTEALPGKRISANLVYRVLEDREGLIWIATTDGLDRFDPASGSISYFRKTEGIGNSLADNFITTLCEDHNGNIWIGTSSYVNMFSKKDSLFTYYSKEHGLPGNQVYSILEDKTNRMWIATGNGLCRFDSVSQTFHAFSIEEGIQSQEFNLGAYFLGKDGEVFFGGMNGFNSFYPDSLMFNTNIPNIVFTSAYKMGKGTKEYIDLQKSNKIVLAHNDYSLNVEFAALEFTNPSRNLFKYRLEGTGDEWIEIENRNFIPFYNLSPGEYELTVLGSNNDGYWNDVGATLTILVRPPWWGSKLAYLVYVLMVMLTVWFIIKRREKQHIIDKMILEEKVKERTMQIEEQKTEILVKNDELKELNASKDKFFSIIAHDLRNPFNNIIGLSDLLLMNLDKTDRENLQKSLEDIKGSSEQAHQLLENLLLWARSHTGAIAFRPEPTDMNYLVRESVALVKTQATQKQITIHTDIEKNCVILADVNMIRTVLRNLLTNALKFTRQKGDVWIRLTLENDFCTISIKDNGIGIPAEKISTLFRIDATYKSKGTRNEPGTGLGLTLCKELVEKHGGKIIVESEPEIGSEFRVILPVNNN